jgi:hypothetical protein
VFCDSILRLTQIQLRVLSSIKDYVLDVDILGEGETESCMRDRKVEVGESRSASQ